jgi:hypothetical protein
MMSEYTSLTSYLEGLKAEREALNDVDVDALVEERLAEAKAKIRAEVEADVVHTKFVKDIEISAITKAIGAITPVVVPEEEEAESSEIITDELY